MAKATIKTVTYRTLTGINYPDGKGGEVRVEADEVVEIPVQYVDGLKALDAIVEVE
jgi:hypothetical protein